ncbi:MAG: dihydropteroate synthase, partial [Rubrivivax sp.]
MPGHLLPQVWHTGRFRLVLDRVHLMGIVNVTPDSFSDGGRFLAPRAAIIHAEQLVAQGADLLDLGAESTRLNATPVAAEEEWRRLHPVLSEVVRWGVPVSVDTHKPEVMRAALDAGADLINDVRALTTPSALQAVAAHASAGVCLMHSRGDPTTMQTLAQYGDVVEDVASFLSERFQAASAAGIAAERIVLDPGYGFAKTMEHSVELLAHQESL